jgi:hypothetical protein
MLAISDDHFSIQPNHFSHSEEGSSTFVQHVETLPLHSAQTQNKTTISIRLFSILFVFVNRLYFQHLQFLHSFCGQGVLAVIQRILRVQISLPHKRMGRARALYIFVLENFWTQVSLHRSVVQNSQNLSKFCSYCWLSSSRGSDVPSVTSPTQPHLYLH